MAGDPDRFEGTHPNPVEAGSELTINYSNPARANETVTIDVDNGEGDTDQLLITLDAGGNGQSQWTVPADWTAVLLNGPDSAEHAVSVTPPTED